MDKLEASERKKIMEIVKNKEKKGGNMDWMYTASKPKSEDYLLGKKIDKHFETGGEPEKPKEDDFEVILGERIKANVALDMQAKVREDPLFAIKKKEEDSRRKLLDNPIKMKKLQKMIEHQKKLKQKKKKKHRHKKGGSDSDSNDDLVNQYLSILTKKQKKHDRPSDKKTKNKHSGGDNSHRETDQIRTKGDHSDKHGHKNRHEYDYRTHNKQRNIEVRGNQRDIHSSSSDEEQHKPKVYGLIRPERRTSPKHERMSPKPRKVRRSRSQSPPRRQRNCSQSPERYRSKRQSRSRSPARRSPIRKQKPCGRSPPRRKLTAEEKQRKLQEMMDNAKWRDDQRKKNVKRYEEEDRKEEETRVKHGSGASFINPLMAEHASQSSVEDRLRRNKYNIQRTKAALDKDFTKQ